MYFITTTNTSQILSIIELSHHGHRVPLHLIIFLLSSVLGTQRVPQQPKLTEIPRPLLLVLLQQLLPLVCVARDEPKVGHHVTAGRDYSGKGRREGPGIVPVWDEVLGREVVHVVQAGQVSLLGVVRLHQGDGQDPGEGGQEEGGDDGDGDHGEVEETLASW